MSLIESWRLGLHIVVKSAIKVSMDVAPIPAGHHGVDPRLPLKTMNRELPGARHNARWRNIGEIPTVAPTM